MLWGMCCHSGCCAESARRKVIQELISVSVSPDNAQRVWLRISGVSLLALQT